MQTSELLDLLRAELESRDSAAMSPRSGDAVSASDGEVVSLRETITQMQNQLNDNAQNVSNLTAQRDTAISERDSLQSHLNDLLSELDAAEAKAH